MKFVLFVEGYTERALPGFLKRWLDPRLTLPVGIRTVRFNGWRHYEDEIAKKVALNLSGRAGEDVIAGIGLLDLYGPTFYPPHMHTVVQRAAWARIHLETKAGHPRFRQYFAIHEVEAWLLADPNILPDVVRKALPGRAAQPETVNFTEPPSRLLGRLYRSKLNQPYKKVIDGASLFQDLVPDVAHAKCPGLRMLLEDMLAQARAIP